MQGKSAYFMLAALGLAACSNAYTYVPVTNSSAIVSGTPAADYPIPRGAGDVQLASIGVENVHPVEAPATTAKALHLRLVASNKSSSAWTIDSREQRLAIEGLPEIFAGNARVSRDDEPPLVEVIPGSEGTVELYFLLPDAALKGDHRPHFDVLWTVHTPSGVITQRTLFDRVIGKTAGAEDDGSGGWGGYSTPSR